MTRTCTHLSDLRRALHNGHWPAAAAPELRTHVASCAHCTQEVLLTTTLRQARTRDIAAAQPMPSSLIWWRAQARRRQAAIDRATRPLFAAQFFAFVIILATAGTLIARHWQSIVTHASTAPASIADAISLFGTAPLIAAAAVISALGGVVLYLTTDHR